ncbi:unnamed protein product [Didymodactylos carnosus]|uniref:Tetratricopeptide repeat protein n=1 Tax=Didymodactylos carnosus TaxID=1234261 RepID=A0A8S2FQ69_9BILA|nr:unnamed protein product [Didymodactylos carnosus]CAF4322145.1 unnamed protein product [Didymodactylos carnosus]
MLEYSQAAFNIYEKIYPSNHSSIANISIRLGNIYSLNKQYDLGITYLTKAIEIDEKSFWSKRYLARVGQSYFGIAACYERMLELDKSFDNYQKSLTIYKTYSKHVENSDFLSVYNRIGKLLAAKGLFDLAREQFQSALNYATEDQNKEEIAKINTNIAICYFKQRDFGNSLVYFHRTLDIYENSIPDTISEAYLYALYCVGQIYKEKKELNLFVKYSNKWLLLVIHSQMTGGEPEKIYDLSLLYQNLNEYDRAIEHYEKYLNSNTTDGKTAEVYFHIGQIYCERTKYGLALSYFQKAITAKEHELLNNNDSDQATTTADFYNNIGWYSCKSGSYIDALTYCLKSKNLYEECNRVHEEGYGNVLSSLGVVYYKIGNKHQAREYCLRSIRIMSTTQHPAMKENYEILANTTMIQSRGPWKKLLITIGLLTSIVFIKFVKNRKLN